MSVSGSWLAAIKRQLEHRRRFSPLALCEPFDLRCAFGAFNHVANPFLCPSIYIDAPILLISSIGFLFLLSRRCPPLLLLRRLTIPLPFSHINTSEAQILNKSIPVCCIRVTHCVFSAEISAGDVWCERMHSCFQLTRDIDETGENVVN
jgi:hypothetical protein